MPLRWITAEFCNSNLLAKNFAAFLTYRSKFIEFDLKPVCKKCYDKFPNELKRRQKKVETQGQKFGKQPAK